VPPTQFSRPLRTASTAHADAGNNSGSARARARSACYVNGAATPLRNVRKLGAALVDVNAQNSSLSLREPATQRALLDMIAGTARLAAAFGGRLAEFQRVRRRLDELWCGAPRPAVCHDLPLQCVAWTIAAQQTLRHTLATWSSLRLSALVFLQSCSMHAVCSYLEDEDSKMADEELVSRILGMDLRPGIEAELAATVRAFEGRAASVQDCTAAHEAIGAGAASSVLLIIRL
jgi:DNA repair ATPase RecN